jgi:hypothetical protein
VETGKTEVEAARTNCASLFGVMTTVFPDAATLGALTIGAGEYGTLTLGGLPEHPASATSARAIAIAPVITRLSEL